jgi:hypothetical protein
MIGGEALDLFIELEAVPMRRRGTQGFKDGERRLAGLLDLVSEYWTVNSVLDRSARPCHPPTHIAGMTGTAAVPCGKFCWKPRLKRPARGHKRRIRVVCNNSA